MMHLRTGFLAVSLLIVGCGSRLSEDIAGNGDSLTVGNVRAVEVPVSFRYQDCGVQLKDVCTVPETVSVVLPNQVGYAGEPEVVSSLDNVIFGERSIAEPRVSTCKNGQIKLDFYIGSFTVDLDTDDETIAESLIDDILDSNAERFTFNVLPHAIDGAAAIYSSENFRALETSCEDLLQMKPTVVLSIVAAENP